MLDLCYRVRNQLLCPITGNPLTCDDASLVTLYRQDIGTQAVAVHTSVVDAVLGLAAQGMGLTVHDHWRPPAAVLATL